MILVYFRRFHLPSPRGTPSQTVRPDRSIIPFSTEIHWRYQDHRRDFGCDVRETYWRLLERWWKSRIVRYMDRFHKIHFFEWTTTGRVYMVPGGDWKENRRPRRQTLYGQKRGNIRLTRRNAKRSKSGTIFFICCINISHFSSTCCTKNFSLISCSTMAKRIQDQKEEERVVTKSRPAVMNLSSFIATSSELLSMGYLTELTWTLSAKHHIVDTLTKGNYTRDEWNNLLQCQDFHLDQLHQNDGEKDARTKIR